MELLIEWGIPLHNRISLCLLVARVALAPSRRIPTCRTCRTCHFNKTAPHRRVRHSLQPHFPWLAQAGFVVGAFKNGRQSRRFLQVHRSMGSTIGPSSSAPPSPRRRTSQLSARWRRRRLRRAGSSVTSLRLSSDRLRRGGRCQPRATLRTRQASGARGASVRQS